jgi:hypothetical protein
VVSEFHDLLEYDALWIDMNEPANFVTGDLDGCDGEQECLAVSRECF